MTRSRIVLWIIAAFSSLLVAAWFAVTIHSPIWQSANEAVAIGKLRDLNNLQKKYAADHPENGFACAFLVAESSESSTHTDRELKPSSVTATQSGYNFAIVNCFRDSKGTVAHYQATAVPVIQGTTGFRAFCTDNSESLWYDANGSGAKCLLSQHSLLSP